MDRIKRLQRGLKRRLLPWWYSLGNQVECSYCGWTGTRFLPSGAQQTPNRLCPQCGSLERYRMLNLYLTKYAGLGQRPMRVLDIAPRACFRAFCQTLPKTAYVSSDLMANGVMVHSDLTQMGIATASFDLITCLHVFEHIPNDKAGFAEIGRMLTPTGFAMLMVPLRGQKTFEDPTASPDAYEKLFGQHDHVRWYGIDIVERIQQCGLCVETLDMFQIFDVQTQQRHALLGEDRYFFKVSRPEWS